MIVIASCGHNCDDERIYHQHIKTLLSHQYKIKYYTYCYKSYLTTGYNDKNQLIESFDLQAENNVIEPLQNNYFESKIEIPKDISG